MGVVVAGYIFAVIMPIIRLILGVIAATRPQKRVSRHGVFIIVVSATAFLVYVTLIVHAGQTAVTCDPTVTTC